MALGYCEALLLGLEDIAKDNDTQFKLTPIGFSEFLNDEANASTEIKSYDKGDGHQVDVRVRYLQRSVEADTQTTRDCNQGPHQPYKEGLVTIAGYRQISIGLDLAEVRKYCSDASDLQKVGSPATSLMREHVKRVLVSLNGLRVGMNKDLLRTMANNFSPKPGGSAAAKDVTLLGRYATGSTAQQSPIWDGWNDVMQDYEAAELVDTPYVVGFGNFNRFNTGLGYACCNDNGINMENLSAKYKYYKDLTAESILGANNFGVFAPGVVQLITFNENRGDFAGVHGASEYGVIPDPTIPNLFWDFQLDFDTCAKKYNLIVSNHYGLWTVPSDAYKSGDSSYYGGAEFGAFRYRGIQA